MPFGVGPIKLAQHGGFVSGPTLTMLGERGAELVPPLNERDRSLELLLQSGLLNKPQEGGGSGGSASGGPGGRPIIQQFYGIPADSDLARRAAREFAWTIKTA